MELKFKELIKTLAKKGGLEIILLLKDGAKRWSFVEQNVGDKKSVSYRIRELANLGIIKIGVVHDTPQGTKLYELTPLGKKIIQHIEEMEREFEEYHRKHSFPDTVEEFINEELEE